MPLNCSDHDERSASALTCFDVASCLRRGRRRRRLLAVRSGRIVLYRVTSSFAGLVGSRGSLSEGHHVGERVVVILVEVVVELQCRAVG
jgi:hypothetical protein